MTTAFVSQKGTLSVEELNLKIQSLEEQLSQLKPKPKEKKIEGTCTCEVCGKVLKNKYTLKTHLKVHQDKQLTKIECPTCHKLYCSKYYLNKHIKEKHLPQKIEEDLSQIKNDLSTFDSSELTTDKQEE